MQPGEQIDRTIFNAIPFPAFVVNGDVQVIDLNDAAAEFCGKTLNIVFRQRGGSVLGCLHANDVAEGCGRGPDCHGCALRDSVAACLEGQIVIHRIVKLQLSQGLEVHELQVLVTASPLPDGSENLALLLVEHIPEVSAIKSLIPICMKCKRILDEEHYWTDVEEYFHEHAGAFFTHGLCPECSSKFSGA